jgi:rare lipoprotein A
MSRFLISCALAATLAYPCELAAPRLPAKSEYGVASWYSMGDGHGLTASGEQYNGKLFTAAHRTLPMGTRIRVTNLRNQRSVVVRINDRGPFVRGRVVDLSVAAARRLGFLGMGLAKVRLDVLG